MNMSAKEEKRRFELDEERKALSDEAVKDEHFIKHLEDVIWHGDSLDRSNRLIKKGRLRYVYIPGECGYVTSHILPQCQTCVFNTPDFVEYCKENATETSCSAFQEKITAKCV